MASKIRKNLVTWFVKNVVAPNIMRIDTPGFATVKKDFRGNNIEQRNVFYSELFMEKFENSLVDSFGEKGKEMSYAVGKDAGHAYSHSYAIPRRGEDNDKSIEDFVAFYEAFMGITWGEFSNLHLDLKQKLIEADLGEHIVCRKNGYGYLSAAGNVAGGWQYVMQDPTIEGVQQECKGRGNEQCKAMWAPAEYIEKQGIKPIRYESTAHFPVDETYVEMNKVRKLEYSKVSMKDLIGSGFFKLENNQLSLREDRYCFSGHEMLYVMEQLAVKNKKVSEILFNSTFEQGIGISLPEKRNEYSTFIPDIISALGLGDTALTKTKDGFEAEVSYFPYLSPYNEINYQYIKGLISGLLTGLTGNETILKKHKVSISDNNLRIELY